jgi:hypothetical protein
VQGGLDFVLQGFEQPIQVAARHPLGKAIGPAGALAQDLAQDPAGAPIEWIAQAHELCQQVDRQ